MRAALPAPCALAAVALRPTTPLLCVAAQPRAARAALRTPCSLAAVTSRSASLRRLAAQPRAARAVRPRAATRAAYEARSESSAAIRDGIAKFDAGDAAGALALFQSALTLPGSGTRKIRNQPAELSTGEKQAAYYNCAVAHATLGEVEDGLEALECAFKTGFGDWVRHGTARAIQDYNLLTESDELAPLRTSPVFQTLLDKYKLVPSRLAMELDFSSSALGRFAAASNSSFKAKP